MLKMWLLVASFMVSEMIQAVTDMPLLVEFPKREQSRLPEVSQIDALIDCIAALQKPQKRSSFGRISKKPVGAQFHYGTELLSQITPFLGSEPEQKPAPCSQAKASKPTCKPKRKVLREKSYELVAPCELLDARLATEAEDSDELEEEDEDLLNGEETTGLLSLQAQQECLFESQGMGTISRETWLLVGKTLAQKAHQQ